MAICAYPTRSWMSWHGLNRKCWWKATLQRSKRSTKRAMKSSLCRCLSSAKGHLPVFQGYIVNKATLKKLLWYITHELWVLSRVSCHGIPDSNGKNKSWFGCLPPDKHLFNLPTKTSASQIDRMLVERMFGLCCILSKYLVKCFAIDSSIP